MAQSNIEWTDMTWNPTTGCTKVSTGCQNCYAEIMARRLKAMGLPKYRNGFELTLHADELETPFRWRKPRTVFVNSMSDLFHRDVPVIFIEKVFNTMAKCPQHRFQILTKRPNRVRSLDTHLSWSPNIGLGVSVENRRHIHRIHLLRETSAKVKFLSLEPLLGPLKDLPLDGIDWVITGGESGPRARPIKTEWVIDIRDQCQNKNIPFFFKQWGGKNKKKAGRQLDGHIYDEMPLCASAAL